MEKSGGVEKFANHKAARAEGIDVDARRASRCLEIGCDLNGIARDPDSWLAFITAGEQGELAKINPAAGAIGFVKAGTGPGRKF